MASLDYRMNADVSHEIPEPVFSSYDIDLLTDLRENLFNLANCRTEQGHITSFANDTRIDFGYRCAGFFDGADEDIAVNPYFINVICSGLMVRGGCDYRYYQSVGRTFHEAVVRMLVMLDVTAIKQKIHMLEEEIETSQTDNAEGGESH